MQPTTDLQVMAPPHLPEPRPDETYLYQIWDVARSAYLEYILNRKGQEKPGVNTHNNYQCALRQFFDGMHAPYLARDSTLGNDWANKILQKYARRAGVSVAQDHLHGLRHARARQTIEDMTRTHGTADVMVIKQLLRHSSLTITQRYIEHMSGMPEDAWAVAAIDAVKKNGTHRESKHTR